MNGRGLHFSAFHYYGIEAPTSGPTMVRGSVIVATISLATSIASWPAETHAPHGANLSY